MNMYGLSDKEVIISRNKYGTNTFTKKKRDSFIKLLLETFGDPIIKILLIALGIKTIFLLRDFDWFETFGIVIAIMVASLISSISEYGSMKVFDKLTDENSKLLVKVIRNGVKKTIGIDEVVVGDLVVLESGDRISADGIIIDGELKLDESMLNGESDEVLKCKDDLVYMLTVVYSGYAIMEVTNVGDNTFYGKMAGELQMDGGESVLKYRLTKLAEFISKIGYIASFIAGLSYLFYMIVINNNFNIEMIKLCLSDGRQIFSYIIDAMTLCVTIIVVSVPEGLPMMITLVLSSNMKRMLKNNVLVRKLVGIETAGNINVLFTDKTGTLTNGRLEVVGFMDGMGESIEDKRSKIFNSIYMNMAINNESTYNFQDDKIIGGNITDRALIDYVKDYKLDYELINRSNFDSKKKYMSTKIKYQGRVVNLVKGAYEEVIKLCNCYMDQNGISHPIFNKDKISENVRYMSGKKFRILALAMSQDRVTLSNMTLIGFVILGDTIRENVKISINMIKNAGIQTVMITGDNKDTAVGIAKEIGLIDNDDDIIMTSDVLDKMSDEDIIKVFDKIKVIARAMPQDKNRLVSIGKRIGKVIGMTGDGVNDALALKNADVGFAMGSGMEIAKEASDIVILDNNISSIANAILYGRTIFKSIRKFIICQLTINFCSLVVSIVGPYIGIPIPITVVQMLWINMIMDTLSGLAFSYEPALMEYMDETPKKKDENIINKYMFNQILVVGGYSSILCILFLTSKFINNYYGDNLMTAFFGLIIFISIFNSFSARTDRLNVLGNITKNRVFIGIIIGITLIQIVLIYKGGNVFRTNGLSISEFILMICISFSVIPVDFLRKVILKKRGYKLGV